MEIEGSKQSLGKGNHEAISPMRRVKQYSSYIELGDIYKEVKVERKNKVKEQLDKGQNEQYS